MTVKTVVCLFDQYWHSKFDSNYVKTCCLKGSTFFIPQKSLNKFGFSLDLHYLCINTTTNIKQLRARRNDLE